MWNMSLRKTIIILTSFDIREFPNSNIVLYCSIVSVLTKLVFIKRIHIAKLIIMIIIIIMN